MKLLREPIFLLFLSCLLAGLVYLGLQPPQALPANAPANQFSADRAMDRLQRLFPENLPHPAGSEQNRLVRDRIFQQLEHLGLSVQLQSLQHCNARFGYCSPVDNIVARLQGSDGDTTHAVLLTAHYDSVDAGPGAGDDGAGVATLLEIADMAVTQGGMTHDLIFLFSDAEEQGLIGADAFASEHEWFADSTVVINLEGRGVTGSSNMFETGHGNRSYIRILAQSLDRPVANSVTREIYRRMPNDTDFSVYRDQNRSGFNFAFTGGAAVYHSAIDDVQRLDSNSLQHHGANLWSLLQVLNQRDLQRIDTDENAVYVDLFGLKLLHFPESSATGLALVLSVLMLVIVRISFRHQLSLRQSGWALLFIVMLVPLLLALAWLVSWPLGQWPDSNPMGHPYPWLGRLGLFLTALLALRLLFNSLSHRATTGSVTLVSWLFFAGLAMILSFRLPAASFLGIVPLVAFALGAVLDGIFRKRHPQLLFARLFGFLAATYLGWYFFYGLEVVASFSLAYLQIAPLLLPLIAALPLLSGNAGRPKSARAGVILLSIPILVICVGQQFIPAHTIDRPRAMNLVHRTQAGQDNTLWHLESNSRGVDQAYAQQQGFGSVEIDLAGRGAQQILARPAELLEFPEIRLIGSSLQEDGSVQRRSLQLQIPEGVTQLVLFLPISLNPDTVQVNGRLALQNSTARRTQGNYRPIMLNRPAAGEWTVEITSPATTDVPDDNLEIPLRARFDLPAELLATQLHGWPLDAQAQHQGHRAEVDYRLRPEF
jgi:hypothetical protein